MPLFQCFISGSSALNFFRGSKGHFNNALKKLHVDAKSSSEMPIALLCVLDEGLAISEALQNTDFW